MIYANLFTTNQFVQRCRIELINEILNNDELMIL